MEPCPAHDERLAKRMAERVWSAEAAAGQTSNNLKELRGKVGELPLRLYTLHNEVIDLKMLLHETYRWLMPGIDQDYEDGWHEGLLAEAAPRSKVMIALDATAKATDNATTHLNGLQTIITQLQQAGISSPNARDRAIRKRLFRLNQLHSALVQTKADFNRILGAGNTRVEQQMRLELTGISTTSRPSTSTDVVQTRSQYQQDLLLTKSIEYLEQRQRCLQRVNDVRGKVALQQERYAQGRTALPGPPSPQPPSQAPSQSSRRALQGVNLHVAARKRCRPGCICACHAQDRNQTPSFLDRIFGQLFVGYAGIPVLSAKCDNVVCQKSQQPQIQAEYWFPAGVFWNQIIRFQATYQTNMGPTWQLKTLRRVPDGAEAVTFAMTGNIDGLKSLFVNGYASPVDVSDTRGYSLLRWAIYSKQYKTCQFLVEQGADPDYRPKALSDDCPRSKASDIILQGGMPEDDIAALRCMTRESDWIDDQNFLRVHKIVTGQIGADLADELQNNPESINAQDAMGRTPLLWAAARGDDVACVTLLNFEADPNILDVYWSGPVAYSADRNHTECTRILLDAGAWTDVKIPGGYRVGSPLNCAARNASDPVLIKTLLDFKADVDACGVDGRTSLIDTARTNNLEFAHILIQHGANINAVTITNQTPLTTAIMHNSHEVLSLLLEHWRQYNVCPRLKGPNLLSLTAQYADLDTIKILSNTNHLRLKYDLSYSTGDFLTLLTKRHDANDKLSHAFELFLEIVQEQFSQEETTEAVSPSRSHSPSPSIDSAEGDHCDRVRELRDEVSALRVDDNYESDQAASRHDGG